MKSYKTEDLRILKTTILHEMYLFPEIQLTDFYKIFYQDYFGPGHFFSDNQQIIKQLEKEISELQKFDDPIPKDVPIYGLNNFLQVNLNMISLYDMKLEDVAEIFYESSRIELYQPLPWLDHWQNMQQLLQMLGFELNPEDQKKLLPYALENQSVHHSETYTTLYHPHYRVIDADMWEELIRYYDIPS